MPNFLTTLSDKVSSLSSFQIHQILRFAGLISINIALAKSGFSLKEISVYETFVLISGSISFFWIGGMFNTLIAYYQNKNADEQKNLLFNVAILAIALSLLSVFCLLGVRHFIQQFFPLQAAKQYFHYLLVYALLSNPSFINEIILLLEKRRKEQLLYACLVFCLFAGIAILVLFSHIDITALLQLMVISAAIRFGIMLFLLARNQNFHLDISLLQNFIPAALPLMISLLLSSSSDYIDGYLVRFFYDDNMFTIFRYGAKELPIVLLLASGIETVMIANVSSKSKAGLLDLRNASVRLMNFLFPLSIISLMASKWLYPIVFNHSFEQSAVIFNVFLLLICSRLVFPNVVLTGYARNRFLLYSSIVEIAVHLCLGIVFLKIWGPIGLAWATIIAFAADKIFLIWCCKRILNIHPSEYIPIKRYSLYSVILILTFLITYKWF